MNVCMDKYVCSYVCLYVCKYLHICARTYAVSDILFKYLRVYVACMMLCLGPWV